MDKKKKKNYNCSVHLKRMENNYLPPKIIFIYSQDSREDKSIDFRELNEVNNCGKTLTQNTGAMKSFS